MVNVRRLPRLAIALGLLFAHQAAEAHARFVDSEPAADAELDSAPHEIVLIFSQAVDPVLVTLTGANGQPVGLAAKVTDIPERVVLDVPQHIEAGPYTVSFHVLAGDSHSIRGDFHFSIVAPEPPVPSVSETVTHVTPSEEPAAMQDPPVFRAATLYRVEQVVRAAFILTLLTAVGLVIFRALIPLSETLDSWVTTRVRMLGAVGAGIAIAYFATVTMGLAGADAVGLQQVKTLLATSIGKSLILAITGFLVLMAAASGPRTPAGIAVALLIISRVVTGHPASQEPGWVLVPAMALHVAAAGFWLGSIWALLRVLRDSIAADAVRILDAFARLALWSVGALLLVGVLMATIHLKSVDALFGSGYGTLVLWKTGGVAIVLLFAGVNKFWLTPRLRSSGDSGSLRISIRIEALFLLGVIALSTVLAATAPG